MYNTHPNLLTFTYPA